MSTGRSFPSPARSSLVRRIAATMLLGALLAACATPGSAEREAASLARFEAAAGEPVPSFRFFSLDGYTSLGERHVAVWTRPREAWLVQVDEPCFDLRWALGIGLTSNLGRVHARFDRVVVGSQRCRITEIRPIDVAALRESERAARASITAQEREPGGAPPSGGADAQPAGGT
jgi:hypothetical protein